MTKVRSHVRKYIYRGTPNCNSQFRSPFQFGSIGLQGLSPFWIATDVSVTFPRPQRRYQFNPNRSSEWSKTQRVPKNRDIIYSESELSDGEDKVARVAGGKWCGERGRKSGLVLDRGTTHPRWNEMKVESSRSEREESKRNRVRRERVGGRKKKKKDYENRFNSVV